IHEGERAQGRRFASRAIPHRPEGRCFPRELMKIVVNEGDGYFSMSRGAFEKYSALKKDCTAPLAEWVADPTEEYFRPRCIRNLDRTDPDLIAVIEQMGAKAAGPDVEFHLIDMPPGATWVVREVCGIEYVQIDGKPVM
ncbi:hypothetical protein, partial [Cupriavidus sp. 8B]